MVLDTNIKSIEKNLDDNGSHYRRKSDERIGT